MRIVDLVKMPADRFTAYLFTLLALIIPGIGYIYLTKDIFLTLELSKLLLLSIFYSLPIFLMCFSWILVSMIWDIEEVEIKEIMSEIFPILFATSLLSLITFFVGLFFYLFRPVPIFGYHNIYFNSLLFLLSCFCFNFYSKIKQNKNRHRDEEL